MSENNILFIRSSKKNTSKSSEGDSSTNEDDVWDDTILIETYDKAVQLAQQGYLKKKQSVENANNSKVKNTKNWKVGDKCRCQYSEDLNYYEADVIDIIGSTGMCIVRYIGYENEEKVALKNLKPSEGEVARSRQLQEAANENGHCSQMEVEDDTQNLGTRSQFPQKRSVNKKKQSHSKDSNSFVRNNSSLPMGNVNSINFPFPDRLSAVMPPPPPPHMFRNFNEDENETEAMSAMLISWYMSGYHTGYYQGLKMAKKNSK